MSVEVSEGSFITTECHWDLRAGGGSPRGAREFLGGAAWFPHSSRGCQADQDLWLNVRIVPIDCVEWTISTMSTTKCVLGHIVEMYLCRICACWW